MLCLGARQHHQQEWGGYISLSTQTSISGSRKWAVQCIVISPICVPSLLISDAAQLQALPVLQMFRVGLNHIYIGVYTVFLAGKSPNIRSYTMYIYSSGKPYKFCMLYTGTLYPRHVLHMSSTLFIQFACSSALQNGLLRCNLVYIRCLFKCLPLS